MKTPRHDERLVNLAAYNERLKAQIQMLAGKLEKQSRNRRRLHLAEQAFGVVDKLVEYLAEDGRPGVISCVVMYRALRSEMLGRPGRRIAMQLPQGQSNG